MMMSGGAVTKAVIKDLDTDSGDMLQVHYKQYKLVSNYNNVKDSRL